MLLLGVQIAYTLETHKKTISLPSPHLLILQCNLTPDIRWAWDSHRVARTRALIHIFTTHLNYKHRAFVLSPGN